jgi:hypothetical protein
MTPHLALALSIARWLDASAAGRPNDWRSAVEQCAPDGVLRIHKRLERNLIEGIAERLNCSRAEASAKLKEFLSELTQSPNGQHVDVKLSDTSLDIINLSLWDLDGEPDTNDSTDYEAPVANADPEENSSSAQASMASTGATILSDNLFSAKASSSQTLAALVIAATSLRATAIFLGLRSPVPQSILGLPDAVGFGENPAIGTVSFETQRSIAPSSAAILPSADELDLTIAFANNVVSPTDVVPTEWVERVQISMIAMGLLGSTTLSKLLESQQQTGPLETTHLNLAENFVLAMGQPVTQDFNTLAVALENQVIISFGNDISQSNRSLDSQIDRPVSQTISNPKVQPQDHPLVSPIEKPGDRPLDNNKLAPVVEPPVLVPGGPITPEPSLPEPIPPVIKNPELPVDVDLPRPVEIDLPKDTSTTVVIPSDRPATEISGFVGVGRGSSPSAQTILDVDILQFTGSGQIARYLQMEQQNQDVVITFEGNELVKVVLKNVALDEIDNLELLTGASAKVGNIIFAGETTTSASFDVFNSDWYRNTLFNRNTTTFLNDLDNFVYGFDNSDDVINGQGGNDLLFGLGGNDLLRGGSGDDILDGGLGHNQLVGNSGKDTFVITPGGLSDVMDFTLGTDKIQLAQGTTYDRLTLTNFTEDNRGGTQVWQGNQLVLRVFNVTSNQLTSEQFVPGQNDRLP